MGRYTIPNEINHIILGHFPGETFEADISAAQEARLVARGQLTVAGGLGGMKREDLDAMAREMNIDPAAHPNKTSLIDAIQANTTQEAGS